MALAAIYGDDFSPDDDGLGWSVAVAPPLGERGTAHVRARLRVRCDGVIGSAGRFFGGGAALAPPLPPSPSHASLPNLSLLHSYPRARPGATYPCADAAPDVRVDALGALSKADAETLQASLAAEARSVAAAGDVCGFALACAAADALMPLEEAASRAAEERSAW